MGWLLAVLLGLPSAAGVYSGYALSSSGKGEVAGCKADLQGLFTPGQGITIGAWVRYTDVSPSRLVLDWSLITPDDANFMNGFGGPGITYFLSNSDSMASYQSSAAFMDWHHYAIVYDDGAGVLKRYIDGVMVASRDVTSYTRAFATGELRLNFGMMCYRYAAGAAYRQCFNDRVHLGEIDDFAMWNRALTDAEVAARWSVSLTNEIAAGNEPDLAIFYNFNDGTAATEVTNLGTAGTTHNLLIGRLDETANGAQYVSAATPITLTSPSFVGVAAIATKAADPVASTPTVVYARPGETIDLSSSGFAGQSYTASGTFSSTDVLSLSDATATSRPVHVVPLVAPSPTIAAYTSSSTFEDVGVEIRVLPGPGCQWPGGMKPVITTIPARGTLHAQPFFGDRLLTAPVTANGQTIDYPSMIVVYTPALNQFGENFDTFAVAFQLEGLPPSSPAVLSSSATFTVSVAAVDDVAGVTSSAYAFTEDGLPTGGQAFDLNLTDAETNQVLGGFISRLPTKGRLFSVNASGSRTLIDDVYNPFDVGAPVVRQYLSRVVRVSSFWGSNPPYAGYHALGILGPPDCENALVSNECSADSAWVGDASLYPAIGQHVNVNGHTGYVRAVYIANGTLDWEGIQYYKTDGAGAWAPCWMDVTAGGSYPADCKDDANGGGLNTAHGRAATIRVARSVISPLNAGIWCPERKTETADTLSGGGAFGPQYQYGPRTQATTYTGQFPYTEWIEVSVDEPVYIFRVILGISRGAGGVVGIRAKDPSAAAGSAEEWVRLYEALPLLDVTARQRSTGAYEKWAPNICRLQFKSDTIRIEVDTSAQTGAADWNYLDYVEVIGSQFLQSSGLPGGVRTYDSTGMLTKTTRVVYEPFLHANGEDSFQYQSSDCTGDMFRTSSTATVAISISPVNDVPVQLAPLVNVTQATSATLPFNTLVSDVETPFEQLAIVITSLPPAGAFSDGTTVLTRASLPHTLTSGALTYQFDAVDGMAPAPDEERGSLLRIVVTGEIGFTTTDAEGAVLTSTLTMRVLTSDISCTIPDHGVSFKTGVPMCEPCAFGTSASAYSPTCNICNKGFFRLGPDVPSTECRTCPELLECTEYDTTLASMELVPGWWRLNNQSGEWHWCGDEPGRVKFELGMWMQGQGGIPTRALDNASGTYALARAVCLGGTFVAAGADASCQSNHNGPLCRSCDPGFYFDASATDRPCTQCPETSGALMQLAAVFLGLVLLGGFVKFMMTLARMPPADAKRSIFACMQKPLAAFSRLLRRTVAFFTTGSFTAQLKLFIAFAQIVMGIPSVYDVEMPLTFYDFTEWLDFFQFQWLFEVGIPTECVGGGIYDRVILYGTLPLIIIFLMPFGATLFELGRRKYSELRGEDVHKRPIYFIFLEALPLSLFVAFVSVIAVSKQIFSVFDCTEFQTDSRTQPATTRSFIASQLTIECSDNPEYMSLRTAAYVFGVIWPVGMPILFILATVPFRRDHLRGRTTPATKATMFLHKEYEPAFYWWEPLALLYRLGLIGYVQLIPSDKKLIRLLVGLIISIIYSFLIVMTKPFAADQVDTLSIATQICLVFMFLAVTVLQIYDSFAALGGDLALKITGFSSREQVGVIIIVFLVGVFIVFAFMLISDALKAQTRLLLLRSDSQPPNLSFEKGMRYHLFLSHVWSSAQDQVAVIKRMMQLLMPGVQIFLDVDDLEDIGNLAKYIAESQCILVFLSRGYFGSGNCRKELEATFQFHKPLVLVHEADPGKGGATLEALRAEFDQQTWKHAKPGPLFDDVDAIITWQRINVFQSVSTRLIGEGILAASPQYAAKVYTQRELYHPGAVQNLSYELSQDVLVFVSANNPGVGEFVEELKASLVSGSAHKRGAKKDSPQWARVEATVDANFTSDPEAVGLVGGENRMSGANASILGATVGATVGATAALAKNADVLNLMTKPKTIYFMLYLNLHTFIGVAGRKLIAEVQAAIERKIEIVLVHENDPGLDGCPFGHFFTTTPQDLIQEGLYAKIAVACLEPPFRRVSLALVSKAFGAKVARKTCMQLLGLKAATPPPVLPHKATAPAPLAPTEDAVMAFDGGVDKGKTTHTNMQTVDIVEEELSEP